MPVPRHAPDSAFGDRKREEARRQANGGGLEAVADGADLAGGVVEITAGVAWQVATQAAGAMGDATGVMLGASLDAARGTIDVIGGVVGGLTDL